MSKLGNFFGNKPSVPAVEDKSTVELNKELFLPIARQLGKENESIRNLLADAELKINELDAIKNAIGSQVEPVSKTLRALEETKTGLATAESKVAQLEGECARLRETLTVTQQKFTALESTHAGQTAELTTRRAQVADLQGRVQQQTGEIQIARDENRRLNERVSLADKKMVQLESEGESTRQKLEATRQKLNVSEVDRTTVQKSLDNALAEMSQMSQRVLEANKLFDDAKQQYENEISLHKMNYEALQTRATLTNKLLEDTRKSMLERAKEIQSSIAA